VAFLTYFKGKKARRDKHPFIHDVFLPFESREEWLKLLEECFHCSSKEAECLFEYGTTEPEVKNE
jgi:hypothetical protein